jgi:hypothetical protein
MDTGTHRSQSRVADNLTSTVIKGFLRHVILLTGRPFKMDTGTRRSHSRLVDNLTSTLMKRHVIFLTGRSFN